MSRRSLSLSLFALCAASAHIDVAVAQQDGGGACTASGATLADARDAYAASCTLDRVDCDPIGGGWTCSSERIGGGSPGFVVAIEPAPVEPEPVEPEPVEPAPVEPAPVEPAPVEPEPVVPAPVEPEPVEPEPVEPPVAEPERQGGACAATGSDLDAAKAAYARRCSARRVDCDPIGSEWTCASYRIGLGAPGTTVGGGTGGPSPTPSEPEPGDTDSPPAPTPSGSLRVEAESGALSSGWASEGSYIIWRGAPDRYAPSSRRDDANIAYVLDIPAAGRYRYTMRSAALEGPNPAEPPNDVWVRFGDVPWTKAYASRDGEFRVGATGERGGRKSASLLESELPAGPVTVTISGRSTGHAIDWIELVRVGGGSGGGGEPVAEGPSPSSTYRSGDLLSLHHDSMPDPDDLQAMIANREVLDDAGDIDLVMVHGTVGHRVGRTLDGSENLARELFGDDVVVAKPRSLWGTSRYDSSAVETVASLWQATLAAGDTVHVAEGGTSDFTALVLEELQSRGVGGLKRVRVVQHSAGPDAFNERETRDDRLDRVKRVATWVPIPNGNADNGTPDFNQSDAEVESRARRSRYAAQWNFALDSISPQRRMDFSDTVELFHILGIPKSAAPGVRAFADRYFR